MKTALIKIFEDQLEALYRSEENIEQDYVLDREYTRGQINQLLEVIETLRRIERDDED